MRQSELLKQFMTIRLQRQTIEKSNMNLSHPSYFLELGNRNLTNSIITLSFQVFKKSNDMLFSMFF